MQYNQDLFTSQCKSVNKSTHNIYRCKKDARGTPADPFYTSENWTSFFTSSSVQLSCSVITFHLHFSQSPFHFFPKYTSFSCHALVNLIFFLCFTLIFGTMGHSMNWLSLDILKPQVQRPCKEFLPKRDYSMHPVLSDINFLSYRF